jgi:hypothetical protein
MDTGRAHFALYDTLNDSEAGLLLVELRTGRFIGACFDVVTVAESREPITTLGGVRIEPDALLADLNPADSDLLVMAGAEMWDRGEGQSFAAGAFSMLASRWPRSAARRRASRGPDYSTIAHTRAPAPTTSR